MTLQNENFNPNCLGYLDCFQLLRITGKCERCSVVHLYACLYVSLRISLEEIPRCMVPELNNDSNKTPDTNYQLA